MRWTARDTISPRVRGLGGVVVLAGGALVIVSASLPWLGPGDVTGWDVYTGLRNQGGNGFFERGFFGTGFSPFFSGAAAVIAGGLLVMIGLAILASLKGGGLRRWSRVTLVVLSVLVAVAGAMQPLITNALHEYHDAHLLYGLWVLYAGAWIGLMGVIVGVPNRGPIGGPISPMSRVAGSVMVVAVVAVAAAVGIALQGR